MASVNRGTPTPPVEENGKWRINTWNNLVPYTSRYALWISVWYNILHIHTLPASFCDYIHSYRYCLQITNWWYFASLLFTERNDINQSHWYSFEFGEGLSFSSYYHNYCFGITPDTTQRNQPTAKIFCMQCQRYCSCYCGNHKYTRKEK